MTSRSINLRQWKDDDLEPFAVMNSDPEVMRFMLNSLARGESIALLERLRGAIDQKGWGLWAVDVDGAFAGYTGLSEPTFASHFTPCIEIAWRLRREFWGQGVGYAAALQAESFAFHFLKIPELVSFTTAGNTRSRNLM